MVADRAVLRAEMYSENMHNYGYLCINGDSIEGVFTFDYAKLEISDGALTMELFSRTINRFLTVLYVNEEYLLYRNIEFSDEEIQSPENYLLYREDGYDWLALSTTGLVTDPEEIEKAYIELEKVRPY